MIKKQILIIGASSEIGLVLCKNFLDNGYNVISQVNTGASRLKSLSTQYPGQLSIYKQDFNNSYESVEDVFPLEGLTTLNGIVHCPSPPIDIKHILKTSWDDFQSHFNVHIKSLHQTIKFLNNSKLLNNTKLVVINSELSVIKKPPKGFSAYGSSKTALSFYCSSLNEDIHFSKLIVNQISPSMFESRLLKKIPAYLKEFSNESKINHDADILEVVNFLLFRASDKVKNQNIHISSD